MNPAPHAKPKPVPVPTSQSQPFWDGTRAKELRLQHCRACGEHLFYPRPHCPHCHCTDLEWVRASGRGTLYSYTVNHIAAPGWEGETPYVVAIVKLQEGPRMLSILVQVAADPKALELDMPLEVVFGPRGEQVLTMFRPVAAKGGRP